MEERRNGINGRKEEWHEWKKGGMVALQSWRSIESGKNILFQGSISTMGKSENIRVSLVTIWSRIGAQHVSDPDPNII